MPQCLATLRMGDGHWCQRPQKWAPVKQCRCSQWECVKAMPKWTFAAFVREAVERSNLIHVSRAKGPSPGSSSGPPAQSKLLGCMSLLEKFDTRIAANPLYRVNGKPPPRSKKGVSPYAPERRPAWVWDGVCTWLARPKKATSGLPKKGRKRRK